MLAPRKLTPTSLKRSALAGHYFEQELKILKNITWLARTEIEKPMDEQLIRYYFSSTVFWEFIKELSYAADRLNKFAIRLRDDPLYEIIAARLDEECYFEHLTQIEFRKMYDGFVRISNEAGNRFKSDSGRSSARFWWEMRSTMRDQLETWWNALESVEAHNRIMKIHPEIKERVFFTLSAIAPSALSQDEMLSKA